MGTLATDSELATIRAADAANQLNAVRGLYGLPDGPWNAVTAKLGGVPTLRIFSSLPASSVRAAITAARIQEGETQRALSPIEFTQVGLVWRVARQVMELPDVLLFEDGAVAAAAGATPQQPLEAPTNTEATRKIRLNQVLDQADEGVVPPLSRHALEDAYATFLRIKGGYPLPGADPTGDQISAMRVRILEHKGPPYADFAIWTPYGNRFQKALRLTSYVFHPDSSTWRAVELPGPPDFERWYSSWQVYANVMLMITTESGEGSAGKEPVVSQGSLEEYFENFRALNNEFPEAWHLLAQAEDRARAEHFLRLRREAEERHARGQEPSYKPNAPWDWVFRLCARDKVYWDRNVRDPALVYLAKGGGGRPVKRPGEDPLEEAVKKKSKKERTRDRREKEKEKDRDSEEPRKQKREAKGGGKGSHPRKDNKGRFVSNREGTQICFKYNMQTCEQVCPNGRAHACQGCLGQHPHKECPKSKPPHL